MTNKIFKHYSGDLDAFKTYVLGLDESTLNLLEQAITFIHPDDIADSGWLYANGHYYTATEVTGVTAETLLAVIDGNSIGVEVSNGKLKLTPVVLSNITSNLLTTVGYVNAGTITNLFTAGMSLDDVLKRIFCKILDYTTTCSITNATLTGTSTPQEVGSTYTPTISFTGNVTVSYNKPIGGSTSQSTKTLTADDYTMTYAFGETANPTAFGTTNSYKPSWTVTEGSKTYYGVAKISNVKSAANLGLKMSDDSTTSTATIADQTFPANVSVTGAYKVYYKVNTTTKLTASSTFEECKAVCTDEKFLTSNVTVLGNTPVGIGSSAQTKYVYVLIPESKITPDFTDSLGSGRSDMTIIKSGFMNQFGTSYKLCALGANGQAGSAFKDLIIRK